MPLFGLKGATLRSVLSGVTVPCLIFTCVLSATLPCAGAAFAQEQIDNSFARQPGGPLIHHSDRGGQYTSDDFRDELAKHGIQCSMSASANCYDNAVVESFFGLLKRERVNRVRYRTRDEARADLFEYIEVFYNRKRRHGYLGNVSPVDFEEQSAGSFGTVH